MLFLIFGVLLLLGLSDGAKFEGSELCSWLPDNNEGSSKLAVSCNVKLLDHKAGNLSNIPQELTSRLKIQCSNTIFFESILPSNLQKLHELEVLQIRNCKLLTIEPNALQGLYNLKRLLINGFNSQWGPAKNLEINSQSFHGLKELQVLDLAENNIRALADEAFCTLLNLQTLNLTRNRIRSTDMIGISHPECNSIELQNLDLSHNEIRLLSEESGFGKLRRLQHLNLQFNNISEVSGESLAGLVSLKVLDLSNNQIGALPQGLFAGSPELKEIHLQNNSLYSLAKGLFHRLEQLLVLDLSGNQLTSNHVDNGTFSGLIRLIVLNLSHNALTRIDSRTFRDLFFLQILDLRNNSIGFIEDNAFLPLYNLHTLNLAENRLNTIGPQLFNGLFVLSKLTLNNNLVVSVDPRAFQNCSALKELDLSSNALAEVPDAIQELSFLKTLDLGENQISSFRNGSFKNLNQLTGLRLIDNTIGNLTRGMLWDLPSLQVLNLAKNKIQTIERGSFDRNTQIEAIRLDENFLADINGIFAELASLLWLNLSENHLVWFDYAFIPRNLKWLDIHGNFIENLANYYKIQTEIEVKTLDASHNRITEINPMSIPNSVELLFINNNFIKKVHPNTFLDKRSLARVDMYANDLIYLDITALRVADLPDNKSLPELYLGGNPFHCDCTMEWLQSINSKNGSKSHMKYPQVMDLDNVMCKMTNAKGMSHMPLSQAKVSDFVCIYETHCFTLCHCCDFDACDCEMTCPNNCSCYHDQTWNTNVVDCSGQGAAEIPQKIPMDATEVYLDGNYIRELQNHAFIGRKNLRNLFVNSSNVEAIQNSTFNSLHALQVLHLEDNNLRELKGYEFEHLDKLQELYLQNNYIDRIGNRSFEPLVSLKILRLDGNKLTVFPVWQFSWNRDLTEIMLANNPWSCRCKFLQELTKWVADNAVKVLDSGSLLCSIPDTKPAQNRELDFNSTVCKDYYAGSSVIDSMLVSDYWPMVVVTLCVVILMLLVVVLWFIFRDPVRVWLYSRYGVRLCNFRDSGSKQFDDGDKLYDAFVCYSPKDEEWVVHSLAAELEPKYQLCLHYRNMPNSSYSQHAVPEAAEASRRLIMVLTRNFLETEWARYELRQAFHEALKGRVYKLVIVEDGPFNEALLDPDLRLYLKTAERVRWGERRFWERLKYALPSVDSRGKINANYRRNINNYTIDSRVVPNGTHHSHHHFPEKIRGQAPPSPSMQMMPPPAYSAGNPLEAITPQWPSI
ncbi:hypothetical protein HUJ05_002579 [Dendroctonus ponderosae]|nr:hypothetical protein HUJ05_002579 [Dendroctonus ponderosae]